MRGCYRGGSISCDDVVGRAGFGVVASGRLLSKARKYKNPKGSEKAASAINNSTPHRPLLLPSGLSCWVSGVAQSRFQIVGQASRFWYLRRSHVQHKTAASLALTATTFCLL